MFQHRVFGSRRLLTMVKVKELIRMVVEPLKRGLFTAVLTTFVSLLLLLWANQIFDLPNLILGAKPEPVDWAGLLFESVIVLITGIFALGVIIRIAGQKQRAWEDLNRKQHELDVRQRLLETIIETQDLSQRLAIALDEIMKLTDCEKGLVSLIENDRYILQQQTGFSETFVRHLRDLAVEAVAFPTEPVTGPQQTSQLAPLLQENLRREGVARWLFLPLRSKERMIGFCLFASSQGVSFPSESVEMLQGLTDRLALVVWEAYLYRTAQERLARLTTLREIDRNISSQLSLDKVIQVVLEKTLPHLRVDAVGLSLMDWERKRAVLANFLLPGGTNIQGEAFALSDSLLKELGTEKKAVFIYDLSSDPRVQNHRNTIREYQLCSYLGVPLVIQDEAIGILHLFTCTPHEFSDEDQHFFTTLAGQAGIAVQNARLYEAALLRSKGMEHLAKLALNLTEIRTEEELTRRIVAAACDVTNAERALYFSYDAGTERLRLQNGTATDHETTEQSTLELPLAAPDPRHLVAEVAATRRAVYVPDTQDEPQLRQLPDAAEARSSYVLPLAYGERLYGVCVLLSSEVDGFMPEQLALADNFASAIATAMENTRLFRETQAAYEELRTTHAQLLQAQKMEAVGTLAAGIAHDFNNLLTAIQGNAELAMMQINEDDVVYRDLKEVQRASLRAADLTRQLLLFSRQQPMERVPVNLNYTIKNMLKMLVRLIGEDIAVETKLEPDLWTIEADEGSLEQVIMNLVINAKDAMPDGGYLVIATQNAEIDEAYCQEYSYARPGSFVCLSIQDTGIGMDEETLQHIFEPFFSTKELGKGTGLGLSVVYGIVKQHEGWINVSSQPAEGARFEVYLPAFTQRPQESEVEAVAASELSGHGERVLVVEDDDAVRAFVVRALRDHGYTVFEATTAGEALDVFESENKRFDLCVSDVVLPDRSGLELVEQLCTLKPELSVLLCSGYTEHKSRWSAIREKGISFLRKPFSLETLLLAVKEALGSA